MSEYTGIVGEPEGEIIYAKLRPGVKAQWLAELRSGKYAQGKHYLRDGENNYCCLGIRCEIAVNAGLIDEPELFPNDHPLVSAVSDRPVTSYYTFDGESGLSGNTEMSWAYGEEYDLDYAFATDNYLAQLNDEGMTFPEIADWAEEHL